jgi:hypothetical protein
MGRQERSVLAEVAARPRLAHGSGEVIEIGEARTDGHERIAAPRREGKPYEGMVSSRCDAEILESASQRRAT